MNDFLVANLVVQARRLLGSLYAPRLAPFLGLWPAAPSRHRETPKAVPVMGHLSAVKESAPAFCAPFVTAFVEAAPTLAWSRSFTVEDVGEKFMDNYGWTDLLGQSGSAPDERLACGVLLLGPDVHYPPHLHEAEEMYIPLSGTAQWSQGGRDWQQRSPGTMIHHLPHEVHAIQTGNEPLLAMYLWRSNNLEQRSRLTRSNEIHGHSTDTR
jgi:mannose-6-phosphate isomerase-like protein (cupin superfamily)